MIRIRHARRGQRGAGPHHRHGEIPRAATVRPADDVGGVGRQRQHVDANVRQARPQRCPVGDEARVRAGRADQGAGIGTDVEVLRLDRIDKNAVDDEPGRQRRRDVGPGWRWRCRRRGVRVKHSAGASRADRDPGLGAVQGIDGNPTDPRISGRGPCAPRRQVAGDVDPSAGR